MPKIKKDDFSIESLLADGWVKPDDASPMCQLLKKIPNRNPLNNSEDSNIELIVHGMYNTTTFAILLPDGGMLNFVANSMKELHEFENKINFYDPPF